MLILAVVTPILGGFAGALLWLRIQRIVNAGVAISNDRLDDGERAELQEDFSVRTVRLVLLNSFDLGPPFSMVGPTFLAVSADELWVRNVGLATLTFVWLASLFASLLLPSDQSLIRDKPGPWKLEDRLFVWQWALLAQIGVAIIALVFGYLVEYVFV